MAGQIPPSMIAELGLEAEIQQMKVAQSNVQNLVNQMQLNDVNEGKVVHQNILGLFSLIEQSFVKVGNHLVNLNASYGISLAQALQSKSGQ